MRDEIAYIVHQAARFYKNTITKYTKHMHRIVQYLIDTREEGIIFDTEKFFEYFPNENFQELWNPETASEEPTAAKSHSVSLIIFTIFPLVWVSKLQNEYSLSITEAEYIALSTVLQSIIPMMSLLEEFKVHEILTKAYVPKICCKAFEDNF